jgi:hypothetical protein
MIQSPRPNTKPTPAPHSAAFLLIHTMIDTTWRAFVPTIGGTILGVWLDNLFGLAPVMTIILVIAGFITSALLIMLQIKSVRRL